MRFKLWHVLGDRLFEYIRNPMESMGIIEHDSIIERYIRTFRERVWATVNTLAFEIFSQCHIVNTMYNAVF